MDLLYRGKPFVFKNNHLRQVETKFEDGKWVFMPDRDVEWMLKFNPNMFVAKRETQAQVVEEVQDVVEPEPVDEPSKFVCPVCGKEYTNKYFYDKHMETKHSLAGEAD